MVFVHCPLLQVSNYDSRNWIRQSVFAVSENYKDLGMSNVMNPLSELRGFEGVLSFDDHELTHNGNPNQAWYVI